MSLFDLSWQFGATRPEGRRASRRLSLLRRRIALPRAEAVCRRDSGFLLLMAVGSTSAGWQQDFGMHVSRRIAAFFGKDLAAARCEHVGRSAASACRRSYAQSDSACPMSSTSRALSIALRNGRACGLGVRRQSAAGYARP